MLLFFHEYKRRRKTGNEDPQELRKSIPLVDTSPTFRQKNNKTTDSHMRKKLSFLKLFCAALVFLLTVAIYNPPHSIELAGEKILSGEWGELIKSLIFCALTSALITVVLAFFLITYHMQRFLMTDISLKFIISVLSPCNSFQEPGDLISNECYFRNKKRNNKTNNKKNRHW